MMSFIKKYLTKQFIFGIILCFGIFSKYILGTNNLIEEVVEFYYKTVKNLILELEKDISCLDNIKINNNRKISKTTISNIILFLLKNKN